VTPHRFATVQLTGGWLPSTAPPDASEEDVTFMFDGLLDEVEDEDLTEVLSEFLVPADE
jgi:hypothetical protein